MAMFVGILVLLVLPQAPDALKRKTWLLSLDEIALAQARSSSKLYARSGPQATLILCSV